MGLRTLALSEERGGAGADALTSCIVTEELAAGDADIAAVLAETSRLGASAVRSRDERRPARAFLPKFLSDDRYHLAFAGHEAEHRYAAGRELSSPGDDESGDQDRPP